MDSGQRPTVAEIDLGQMANGGDRSCKFCRAMFITGWHAHSIHASDLVEVLGVLRRAPAPTANAERFYALMDVWIKDRDVILAKYPMEQTKS